MTQRERLLLSVIVGLILLGVVWFALQRVTGMFQHRWAQLKTQKEQLADQEFQVDLGQRAGRRLAEYENRALPDDKERARAMFQHWLLEAVDQAGLEDPKVTAEQGRTEDGVFFRHPFRVGGRGDLRQLTNLLHTIYASPLLHRVEQMTVKPMTDNELLKIDMIIEAVSLPNSPNLDAPPEGPSDRIQFGSLADYERVILERNLFGPPNQPPRISGVDKREVYVGEQAAVSIRASDADEDDRLTYRLQASAELEAMFDEQGGRLAWTPTEIGTIDMTAWAMDNGLPAKESEPYAFTISVVERPPTSPPPPPPPAFDSSKFAYVTGVVEVNGVPQVWVLVRTDGTLLKLHEGQAIEVGQFRGTITRIHPKSVEIHSGDKNLVVRHGQNLAEATPMPEPGL